MILFAITFHIGMSLQTLSEIVSAEATGTVPQLADAELICFGQGSPPTTTTNTFSPARKTAPLSSNPRSPMPIIAIVNPKGGQAKTTLAVHLAHAAVRAGRAVLLTDLDSQASLSLSFPPAHSVGRGNAADLFGGGSAPVPEAIDGDMQILRADKHKLRAVPSQDDAAARLAATRLRTLTPSDALCIVDTKGTLDGTTTAAALYAADFVVCPFELGAYEADALRDLSAHLRHAKSSGINPKLRVLGLLPTRVNTRSTLEVEALEDLRRTLGDQILPVTLPQRTAVKQATMRCLPVWQSPNGEAHRKAAHEWLTACNLILQRAGVLS